MLVITLENFRLLNGAILRNAQTICPVSDLHMLLGNASESEQGPLLKQINDALEQFGKTEAEESDDEEAKVPTEVDKDKGKEKDVTEAEPAEEHEHNEDESEEEEEEDQTGEQETQFVPYENTMELLNSELMRSLTIGGASGLFVFGNSMNHSCAPNVIVVSCFNNFLIRVVAIQPIAAGDELCFSYIDEEMPYDQRQRALRELYLFECKCPKCVREEALLPKRNTGKGGTANGAGRGSKKNRRKKNN
jgi:hypothetical protein